MSHTRRLDPLLTEQQIRARVRELADEISRDHPDGFHVIAVLKGAFVFLADLIRHIDVPVTVDFVTTSSYSHGTATSGDVRIVKDIELSVAGRDVVILEDIVDSGLTLTALYNLMHDRQPRNLRAACLLSKPSRRQVAVTVDYVGFTIEDRFVVGYGLDHDGMYRNLPYLAVLS